MIPTFPDFGANDPEASRRILRDVVTLSTLPAMWFGADRVRIAESLAAALFTTLGPEFVCVTCAGERGHAPIAVMQTDRYQTDPELAGRLAPTFLDWVRGHDPDELLDLPSPLGSGPLKVTVSPIGHLAEFGAIAAGFPADRAPRSIHRLMLNVAATQAGAAIRNAQLLSSLRDDGRTLEVLHRTGAALARELDLQRIVQTVTDAAVELTGARFGAFFYTAIDEAGGKSTLFTLSGADQARFRTFPHPRSTPVLGPAFRGTAIVRSADITADPNYGQNPPFYGMPPGHLPIRSYLAVPVTARSGEVVGGLFLGHSDTDVFSERSERIVAGLATQAAIAMENARLFEAVQRANQTLEERVRERTRELEAAHEALRQAQKMEAIGQLTGGIAHDFNNLLTVIRGAADLLQRGGLSEARRQRYIEAISDTAERAAKLTGQLLAFARRQALAPEVFDAALRVRHISEMLRTILGTRIRLEVQQTSPQCFIRADPAQFETALVNMVVNARDAMNGEGRLTIRIGKAEPESGVRSPKLSSDCMAIEVIDTGPGIAPQHIDRIFEPFFTTKEVGKGTGLGLSQVYGFAQQSGGWVGVRSQLGQGATFVLYLPSAIPEPQGDTDLSASVHQAGDLKCVLVVEDNADVREFVDRMLTDLGFRTALAASAGEALDYLERDHAAFDVVFSDVVMPGMGGIEFGRRVRERWPGLPVVLTSGYSHVLVEETGHGFPLLHKPYTAESLARILRDALVSSSAAEAAGGSD